MQAKIDGACQRKRASEAALGGREGGPLKESSPALPGFRRTFSASRVRARAALPFPAVALDMQELALVPDSRCGRIGGRTVIGRCLFNIFSAAQRQKRQSSVWSSSSSHALSRLQHASSCCACCCSHCSEESEPLRRVVSYPDCGSQYP